MLKAQKQVLKYAERWAGIKDQPGWTELWLELRKKKSVYDLWKKGQATQNNYKMLWGCARTKLEGQKPNLSSICLLLLKIIKQCFYKYINKKRKTKENLHSLLDMRENIVMEHKGNTELVNASFGLNLSKANCSQGRQPPELDDSDSEWDKAFIILWEIVGDMWMIRILNNMIYI